jgi:hypothetical protein
MTSCGRPRNRTVPRQASRLQGRDSRRLRGV